MRAAFEEYATKRVNIAGQACPSTPESPTTDAEWIKHNLARSPPASPTATAADHPSRTAPTPNACLTCPDFQTTVEFLPVHHRQADQPARSSRRRSRRTPPTRRQPPGRGSATSSRSSTVSKPSTDTMTPPENTAGLVAAAKKRHDDARRRAIAALRRLDHTGEPVNIST